MSQGDVHISAVIPTHNRSRLLVRAIESVYAQTFAAAEIVVVDDGSTDDTREQVEKLASVRYVWQENAGGGAARNRGVEVSRSPWVAFLDSDDVWTPEHLERMAGAIRGTQGRAALYFADTRLPSSDATLWEQAGFEISGAYELGADGTEWGVMRTQPMMLQSSVFDRARFLAQGGFDETLIRRHDTDLFLRTTIGQPVCAVSGVGCDWTDDDKTETRLTVGHHGKSRVYWESTITLYSRALAIASERGLDRTIVHEFRVRKAIGHWRLFRLALEARRIGTCFKELLQSAVTAPGTFLARLPRAVRRRSLKLGDGPL